MVVAFFPDISQLFIDLPLFEVYPPKHGCPLPSTRWVVKLLASTLLVEEGWLLRQRHLFIMTRPLPRPNNLLAFTSTCLLGTCPINTFLKSLCVAVRLEVTI